MFLAHTRHDVVPGVFRDHVARVAAESVRALAAPEQEDLGHVGAQSRVAVVEFHQVGPSHAPGAGREKLPVGLATVPFGMVRLQGGGPAGVVGGHVHEKQAGTAVDLVGQLAELVEWRGALVEFGEGGVHGQEIQRGEGRAETSHAREDGRHGMHRQELQDPKAHTPHDSVELAHQVAEGAGGRDHRIAEPVEGLLVAGGFRRARVFAQCGAELARESGVDRVGAGGAGGRHLYTHVVAFRPLRHMRATREETSLAREHPGLGQRYARREMPGRCLTQRQVVPVARQNRFAGFCAGDDLALPHRRKAEVGAEHRAARARPVELQPYLQHVARPFEMKAACIWKMSHNRGECNRFGRKKPRHSDLL